MSTCDCHCHHQSQHSYREVPGHPGFPWLVCACTEAQVHTMKSKLPTSKPRSPLEPLPAIKMVFWSLRSFTLCLSGGWEIGGRYCLNPSNKHLKSTENNTFLDLYSSLEPHNHLPSQPISKWGRSKHLRLNSTGQWRLTVKEDLYCETHLIVQYFMVGNPMRRWHATGPATDTLILKAMFCFYSSAGFWHHLLPWVIVRIKLLIDTKYSEEQLTCWITVINSAITVTTLPTTSLIIRRKATTTKLLCGKTCTLSVLQAIIH